MSQNPQEQIRKLINLLENLENPKASTAYLKEDFGVTLFLLGIAALTTMTTLGMINIVDEISGSRKFARNRILQDLQIAWNSALKPLPLDQEISYSELEKRIKEQIKIIFGYDEEYADLLILNLVNNGPTIVKYLKKNGKLKT
jgi:hypothetical protein